MIGDGQVKLLLIEDEPADAVIIQRILSNIDLPRVETTYSKSLSEGFNHLKNNTVDIILSDLALPDSHGMDTLASIIGKAPDIPVIALTGLEDEELAIEAVRAGAQDYLVKGQIDRNVLARSIRYSIERHRLVRELKEISITDELTGLYNRRGFLLLADKQLELASRIRKVLWLIYMDVDNMKYINDNFGHEAGDKALIDTATIMKETFRKIDTVARVGGDEFAVIALEESEEEAQVTISRLKGNITTLNKKIIRPYELSVSIGSVPCKPKPFCDINDLLVKADRFMYEQKSTKRK